MAFAHAHARTMLRVLQTFLFSLLALGSILVLYAQYAIRLTPETGAPARFRLGSGADKSFVPADWDLARSTLPSPPDISHYYYTVPIERVPEQARNDTQAIAFLTKDSVEDLFTTTTTGRSWVGGTGGLAASPSTPERDRSHWRSKSVKYTPTPGLPLRRLDGGKSYQRRYNDALERLRSKIRKSAKYTRRLRGSAETDPHVVVPTHTLYKIYATVQQHAKPLSGLWLMATCLCCMFDPTNNPNSFNLGGSQCNYRTPPSWGPERDAQYPFRAYCLDVRLWTMVTDLPPRQQGAALIMRLTGAAKHSTRTLSPDEIYNGGVVRGRRLEPIGYILAGLSMR